jgi:two-component system sensor histidine kinase CreC
VVWITQPLKSLMEYALAVRDGRPAKPPRRLRGEMKELFDAYEQMRLTLEGKQYAEHYVQALTHALKSPLAAMQGNAELLMENPPSPTRDRFLSNLVSETTRMRETVDRLLSLAQLETRRGLDQVQTVAMSNVAREVIEGLNNQIRKKGMVIELIGQGSVKGDPLLLRTALMNLIENAIDFSPIGGKVTLRIQLMNNGLTLECRLEDQGPGLPEYALARMGERFFSLPRPDTGRKGTGLGISWVKEVARLHGGELNFENLPEQGLAVIWSLPASSRTSESDEPDQKG